MVFLQNRSVIAVGAVANRTFEVNQDRAVANRTYAYRNKLLSFITWLGFCLARRLSTLAPGGPSEGCDSVGSWVLFTVQTRAWLHGERAG
jgi:hypothetical protein